MAAPGAAGTATEFSSEKLSLAMIILGEQFGGIVQAVGAAMLRRGQMTLTDLVSTVPVAANGMAGGGRVYGSSCWLAVLHGRVAGACHWCGRAVICFGVMRGSQVCRPSDYVCCSPGCR